MFKKLFGLFVIMFSLVALVACIEEEPTTEDPDVTLVDIPTTAIEADDFDILVQALVEA